MEKKQNIISHSLLWEIILSLLVFFSLFRIKDNLGLFGCFISIVLLFRQAKTPIVANAYDCIIFCIWLYTGIGVLFSVEPIVSYSFFKSVTYSLYAYMIVRTYCTGRQAIRNTSFAISGLIGVVGVLALVSFQILEETASAVGFLNVYHLRHLYHPMGYLSNTWSALSILFLGILICGIYWHRHSLIKMSILYVIAIVVLFNTVISFSRGTYIALFVLLLSITIMIICSKSRIRHKLFGLLAIFLPLCMAVVLYHSEVYTTLQMTETVSQQRSIAGRMNQVAIARELAEENYLIGTGGGTYNMVVNNSVYETDNIGFSNVAPNRYIQLYVEQGAIGLILWIFLAIILAVNFRQSLSVRNGTSKQLIIISVIAVVLREATTATLFNVPCFGILLSVMLGILSNNIEPQNNKRCTRNLMTSFISILSIVSIGSIACNYLYLKDIDHNNRALILADNGQYEEAVNEMEKTSCNTPFLINRAVIAYMNFKATGDMVQLSAAIDFLEESENRNPYDPMIIYYKAVLLADKGNTTVANKMIRDLADKYPSKSLYNLTAFDMLYSTLEEKDSAMVYLERTIDNYPPFLASEYWRQFCLTDSSVILNTIDRINSKRCRTYSPIEDAIYGAVLTYLNQYEEAIPILENSVRMMPHLIYPWYHLYTIYSDIYSHDYANKYFIKFLFLNKNIRSLDDFTKMSEKEVEDFKINRAIVSNNYELKFHSWYLCQTKLIEYFDI